MRKNTVLLMGAVLILEALSFMVGKSIGKDVADRWYAQHVRHEPFRFYTDTGRECIVFDVDPGGQADVACRGEN